MCFGTADEGRPALGGLFRRQSPLRHDRRYRQHSRVAVPQFSSEGETTPDFVVLGQPFRVTVGLPAFDLRSASS
jgi:hypothetical protein